MARLRGGLSGHYVTPAALSSYALLRQIDVGLTAIHEIMHQFGDDRAFAAAAADIAEEQRPAFSDGRTGDYDASKYWGERLSQACGLASPRTNMMTNYRLYP